MGSSARRSTTRGPDSGGPGRDDVEPEAADAAARAAADRLATVLAELERLDVTAVALPRRDAERAAAHGRARERAIAAGRGALLDEATTAARDLAIQAFARRGFSGTWAAADWSISTAGPLDRVAVALAFEEAATAAVTADIVDPETADVLRSSADRLRAMTGTPEPGSLSQLGGGHGVVGPVIVAVWLSALVMGFAVAAPVGLGLLAAGIAVTGAAAWSSRTRGAG